MVDFYSNVLLLLQAIDACLFDAVGGMAADAGEMSDPELAVFRGRLAGIKRICVRLEIDPALQRIARIERESAQGRYGRSFVRTREHLKTLRENIEDDLMRRIFWYVPQGKVKHLLAEKDLPFPEGADAEQAREEHFEAQQCFALERYTACVVHTGRVAELCLRALARYLVGNTVGDRPVEFKDWNPLLKAVRPKIEEELEELGKEPRTPERAKAIRFRAEAMSHLAYFKTVRDEAAHARATYDEGQALSALNRAKEFAELMAEGLPTRGA